MAVLIIHFVWYIVLNEIHGIYENFLHVNLLYGIHDGHVSKDRSTG